MEKEREGEREGAKERDMMKKPKRVQCSCKLRSTLLASYAPPQTELVIM